MSTRAFTVYRDEPSVVNARAKQSASRPLGKSNSASAGVGSSRGVGDTTVASSIQEKENVNPLTGLSLSSANTKNGKKRKASESSTVLATKVLAAAPDPVQKPARVPLKRRSSVQLAPAKPKVKRDASKKKEGSVGGQAPSLSISRSSSKGYLEVIKEEPSSPESPKSKSSKLTQSQIDTRCYDLTVSPLADVSDAFIQSPDSKKKEKEEDLVEYRMVKDVSSIHQH